MARVPQVTRCIKQTKVLLTCIDVEGLKVEEKEIYLTGRYKKTEDIVKYIEKKNILGDTHKLVNVKKFETVQEIYGLSEEEFLKVAKPIATRFTKAN